MSASEVHRPSWAMQLLETRAIGELAAYAWSYPFLHLAPRGDGHAVLVLPGFLASGKSTFPLRHILERLGYKGHRWKLGRNLGPSGIKDEDVLARMHELRVRYGRRVSLIGWSLGGLYARELARAAPNDVRMVITLGSPIRYQQHTSASWIYNELHANHLDHVDPEVLARVDQPLPVPCTSIYSRSDGVVPWQCALNPPAENAENIRVYGSHCGLGHNPAALWAMFDRLALPADQWRPFERKLSRSFTYPKTDTLN